MFSTAHSDVFTSDRQSEVFHNVDVFREAFSLDLNDQITVTPNGTELLLLSSPPLFFLLRVSAVQHVH